MSKKITSLILSLVLLLTTLTVSPISDVWGNPDDGSGQENIDRGNPVITISDGDVAVQGNLPAGTTLEADPVLPALNPQKLSGIGAGTAQPMGSGVEVDEQNPGEDFLAVYDIKLVSNGEYIQPTKPVTVTISGLTFSGSPVHVLHILEDAELIAAGLANGTVQTVTEGSLFELAAQVIIVVVRLVDDGGLVGLSLPGDVEHVVVGHLVSRHGSNRSGESVLSVLGHYGQL